jgi:hypothetical protein
MIRVGRSARPPSLWWAATSTSFDIFRFSLDGGLLGSGAHVMVVTATDLAGARLQTTVQVPIANPPQLGLTAPLDAAIVNASLLVNGSTSTDKPGPVTVTVTVTASLADYPFLQTTNPAFSGSFSLSGLVAGAYTLTVQATDSAGGSTRVQRTITVASSSALVYSPLLTLGAGAQLIAVDNTNPDLLLYKSVDGNYRLRNTSAGTELTLQGADLIPHFYRWAMDGGQVFAEGGFLGATSSGATDCPLDCVFHWNPSGERRNLSSANPNPNAVSPFIAGGRAHQQYPRAHADRVLWTDAAGQPTGTYTLYDMASGNHQTINCPTEPTTWAT